MYLFLLVAVSVVIFPGVSCRGLEHLLVGVSVADAAEHEAVAVLASSVAVAEPGVFVGVLESADDAAEPQAVVDIALAFGSVFPLSGVAAWVDSSLRPRFCFFASIDWYAIFSSCSAAADEESVHSSTDGPTNSGLCKRLSSRDPRHNKSLEHCYSNPNRGYRNASDTSVLPMGATTSHSRKIYRYRSPEQRTHCSCLAELLLPGQMQKQPAPAQQNLCSNGLLP